MKEPRIYNSRWDKARLSFLRANPLCRMCQEQGRIVAATVVDHTIPHKLKEALKSGDQAAIAKAQTLFWDKDNWQGLCVSHHSSTKQRMEKGNKGYGCDENGMPGNPHSHWYQQNK
ncbi:MAG: HNH endonuclease [Candidatus Symbiopectobacterium sp. Dall1.0]|nr:HNH endonuclease [Candidatus Symbiopectobacterium sp. Dall1.0]